MYVCVNIYVYIYAGVHKSRKKELDLPELEFQAVMSGLMWILGIKSRSSVQAGSVLNHLSVSSPIAFTSLK